MKFNPDCVRDILITAENEITDSKPMKYGQNSDYEKLAQYSFSEVAYHIQQCQEYKLIEYKKNILGEYQILKILPDGNELLAKSEKEHIWKSAIVKGIYSIPSMISTVNTVFEMFSSINP